MITHFDGIGSWRNDTRANILRDGSANIGAYAFAGDSVIKETKDNCFRD